MARTAAGRGGLRHESFLYRWAVDLLEFVVPLARDGVAAEEPTLLRLRADTAQAAAPGWAISVPHRGAGVGTAGSTRPARHHRRFDAAQLRPAGSPGAGDRPAAVARVAASDLCQTLTRARNCTELPHETQHIDYDPLLGDPAIREPIDVYSLDCYLPFSSGNTHELTAVGAVCGEVDRDKIFLSDEPVGPQRQVGKGPEHPVEEVALCAGPNDVREIGVVSDIVWR
jgi:hypothetical protein